MNQSHAIAAFRTSGDTPSKGARITELLLVRIDSNGAEVARLQYPLPGQAPSDLPALTPNHLDALIDFVGAAFVVTHDGYNWKRFLRQEFASQPTTQLKGLLARTIDVSSLSQQQFPKQRKNVTSLLKRLNIIVEPKLVGLNWETAAIGKIFPLMTKKLSVTNEKDQRQPLPSIGLDTKRTESFFARLKRAGNLIRGVE